MCYSFVAKGLASARQCLVNIKEIHNMIRGSHASFTSILKSVHVDANSLTKEALQTPYPLYVEFFTLLVLGPVLAP